SLPMKRSTSKRVARFRMHHPCSHPVNAVNLAKPRSRQLGPRGRGLALAVIAVVGADLAAGCASSGAAASSPDTPPASASGGGEGNARRPPRRPGMGPGGEGRDGESGAGARELEQAIKLAQGNDLDGAIKQAEAALQKNPNLEKAYLLVASSCAMK